MIRRLVRLILDAALVAALVAVGLIAYGIIGNRWYSLVSVQGGSMEPTIGLGDLIVVTPAPAQIQPGMVLVMSVDGRTVTHRVIEVRADGSVVTRGDANPTPDDWQGKRVEVFGEYRFSIPILGRFLHVRNESAASFTDREVVVQRLEIGALPESSGTPVPSAPPEPSDPPMPTAPPPSGAPVPAECAGMRFAEIIVGTPGDDIISSRNGGALILGLDGNDTITGGNGQDCVVGGAGNDHLAGGNGKDVLVGGEGDDTLGGNGDDDVIDGGNGKDQLDGGPGADLCLGGAPDRFLRCESVESAP